MGPRRVSERNDDDVLRALSSGSPSLEEQLEQIQQQLRQYQQKQQILTRRVSDWNNIVAPPNNDRNEHFKHQNSVDKANEINEYNNENFDGNLNNENKRNCGRRCSLGFVR